MWISWGSGDSVRASYRKISVGTPDVGGREDILKLHARNKPLAENVNLKQVADMIPASQGRIWRTS